MESRWHELKEDVGESRLALVFSASLASILFIFIFARQSLYPFGDYTLVYVDGDQYASLMRMVNDAIVSGESFLYSFRTVLGSGAIATEGYYAMSPFNLLLFLFPNNLVAGIHFIACVKHICAALSFCILLNACHDGRVEEKAVFSACYAFIGYMSFFAWNLSWMDGVIVLPLVALGMLYLVKEGKIGLYTGALAFAVISNFYIGFMICIASLMLYPVVLLVYGDRKDEISTDGAVPRDTAVTTDAGGGLTCFKSLPRYVAASLTGVALSGFVLVPAVLGLPHDRKETLSDLFRSMHPTLRPADLFSMLFTGRMCAQSANLPVIFSGILPLLLVVLFFFRTDLPRKKKMAAFAVFAFLAFSFWNSMLNMIWHGMSENVWYNYRYSFVCSFFLLILAFDTLVSMERARVSFYRVAVCLFVFCVWMYNDAQSAFYAEDITRDAVLLAAGLVLFRILRGKTAADTEPGEDAGSCRIVRYARNGRCRRTVARALLLVLMCLNVYRNAVTVMWPDVKDSDSAAAFKRETKAAEQAIATIEDDGFYRMEKNWRLGRADGPLLRYYGVSNYTSTENVALLETLRSYGIAHGWKWGYHTEHTPFVTDAFLGLKYLLSKTTLREDAYTEVSRTEGITVYENKSALPLVMFSETLPGMEEMTDTEKNMAAGGGNAGRQGNGRQSPERLNELFSALAGRTDTGKTVFTEIESIDHAETSLYYKIFTVGTDLAGLPVYLYLDFPVQTIYVYADDDASSISYSAEQYVYNIGTFAAGTRVQVCLYVPQPVVLVEEEESRSEEAYAERQNDAVTQADVGEDGTDPRDEEQGVFVGEAGGKKVIRGDAAGQTGTQTLPAAGEGYTYRYFRLSECLLYAEHPDVVAETAKNVQAHTKEIAVSGNRVNATILADTAGYAVTTIPYDEAWRIDVDGVRVQPVRYMEQFLAVPVEEDEHTIAMYYTPRGFVAGVLLTVLGLILLAVFLRKNRTL